MSVLVVAMYGSTWNVSRWLFRRRRCGTRPCQHRSTWNGIMVEKGAQTYVRIPANLALDKPALAG